MKERFILRLAGLLVILEDVMLTLDLSHRAVVYDLSGISQHFFNGTIWIGVIAAVGLLLLWAPKWLIQFLRGDSID